MSTASFGSEVTVIEALDRILPLEDAESSALMQRSFKKRKMKIMTGARLESSEPHGLRRAADRQGQEGRHPHPRSGPSSVRHRPCAPIHRTLV